MNLREEADLLTHYYLDQAGNGGIYQGSSFQKGYGIGSFLSGLFRSVLPLLKRSGAVISRELVKSGENILSDLGNDNTNFKSVMKNRGGELFNNLKRKALEQMGGSGGGVVHKAAKRRKISQSSSTRRKGKNVKRKVVNKKKKKQLKKKKTLIKKKKVNSKNLAAKRLDFFA